MLGTAAAACSAPRPDADTIAQAYAQAEAGDWDAARATAKAYLLHAPRSIAAHYLLAQTYHYQEPLIFELAQGEYGVALRLYQQKEPLGFLETRLAGDPFPGRLYQQLATLHLRWAESGVAQGAPVDFALAHLKQAREYVGEALSFHPAAVATLRDLDQFLERRIAQLETPRERQDPPAPAPPGANPAPPGVHRV